VVVAVVAQLSQTVVPAAVALEDILLLYSGSYRAETQHLLALHH
jgi:hypothetical protein